VALAYQALLTAIGNRVTYATAIIAEMFLLAATSLSERIKMETRSCSYDYYLNCILPDLVMVASELDTVTSGRSSLSCSARVEPIP